jgi:hypothetical protein
MPKHYTLPLLAALIATQVSQGADSALPSNGYRPGLTALRSNALTANQPPSRKVPIYEMASAATEAQAVPQNQSTANQTHRHTLRNIVIITVVVGVLIVVLAAAAKK